mgnify:CR=1 FL=1
MPAAEPVDDHRHPVGRSLPIDVQGAADTAAQFARDALYTAVGLGILGYQRLQVRRREIERELQRDAESDR